MADDQPTEFAPANHEPILDVAVVLETRIADLRGRIHDIELDLYDDLEPELHKIRDDVAVLKRKADRLAATERDAASSQMARLYRAALARADHLDATANRAITELRTIRGTRSWRLTAPLRAIWTFASRLVGGL